jgi:hypothetical protein
LTVGAVLVGLRHLVHVVHADDAHEGAEWKRPHPVLGVTAPEAPQARSEADEELGRLHPGPPGGHEVPQLVEEDRDQNADHEDEPPHVEHRQQCDQPHDPEHAERAAPTSDELVVGQLGHRAAGDDLVLEPLVPAHVVISSITRSAARRAA